ncbi:kunitz-type protease inhibitor 1b isoform X1 [Siphateles boraxobius]|uniref:kunitz-type protease inhibitor 1b isoform X1 n=1 Tax=Siphateles boraxobius TaxID=180520 RepID=UPI004063835D
MRKYFRIIEMGSWCFLYACLLLIVGETQSERSGEYQQCVDAFIKGPGDFVLDTKESIKNGAVFLANPSVEDNVACTVACCRDRRCNLALIEQGKENEKGSNNNSCFLFNCLYKHKYVCRFIKKEGFANYILGSVYGNYLNGHKADKDNAPIANAGRDVVVQPHEEVLLNGIESWDDGKIVNYEWSLIHGDKSVQMEKTNLSDQIRVSNLMPGVYEFKLTVTDSAHHSDSDQVSVLVLTPEQSEHNCVTPKKAGPCKGAFTRWHYNAASSKCEQFVFGGCKDNNNNYLSERECLNACRNITVIPGGDTRKVATEDCSPCGEEQFKCSNGCCVKNEFECDGQQQCSDGSDENNLNKSLSRLLEIGVNEKAHCTDPPLTGPCRASITHWYYDPLNKKCHKFTYGGCDGNENNFDTTDTCMSNCSGVTEKDVFARGVFSRVDEELGESQSASVALAVVLVVGILAVLAVLGYFFLKNRRKNHQHQPVATSGPPGAYSEDQQMVYNSTTAKA